MTSDNQELEARAFALFEQSLKQDREVRRNWIIEQAGSDAQLRNKTLALLDSDESGPDILMTGAAVAESHIDETPPERIGAYKIGEKLGQGGMGTVYHGTRDSGDFDHTVAIKLIKPGIISDNLKDRFAHEQQVMAGFSHNNIAHLYDGGTTDEGAPYIIMELIDGVSITDWVRQNNLGERQCLDIFRTACQAVSYAHQNLIIHRDLTPGNVLVTKDGVVKLIDFGIAKPYDEDAAAQDLAGSLASLSFTPGFAAPERSKGAAANTLSDIYSLGKLLEDILPEGTMNTDLQAIYNKATALEPDNRYASVDTLIDDVKRYGSGYFVHARNGGAGYKFAKFIRRNSLATALGSIALAGLVGGLILTTSLYRQAEAARQEADARFQDVRNLANTMMFDIYDEISDVPGGSEAEIKLAEAAQKYLDDLSADTTADQKLKLETAQGFFRLARIQGNPSAGTRKRISEAKANYTAAERLLIPLLTAEPENQIVRYELYRIYYDQADMALFNDHNVAASFTALQKAEGVIKTGEGITPLSKELRLAQISTKSLKSIALARDLKNDESLTLALEVKRENLQLAKDFPDDKKIQRRVAISLNNLGRQMINLERFGDAQNVYTEALSVVKSLYDLEPDNDLYQRDMAYTYWRRALAWSRLKNGAESLKDFNNAHKYIAALVRRDPKNANHLTFAYVIKGESMLAYTHLGQYEKAELVGLEYVQNTLNYSEIYPDDNNIVRDTMVAYQSLVDLYQQWPQKEKQCNSLQTLFQHTAGMEERKILSDRDRKALDEYRQSLAKCVN